MKKIKPEVKHYNRVEINGSRIRSRMPWSEKEVAIASALDIEEYGIKTNGAQYTKRKLSK